MNDELPIWCCASGCKHCSAWANHLEPIQPASAWCESCEATAYRDEAGQCESCKDEP